MATNEVQRRGVSWVLRQAAVVAVLAMVAVHVAGVISLTLRQRELASAAEGALAEARLPDASLRSIQGAANRRLDTRHGGTVVSVSLYRKPGAPTAANRLRPGDRVNVRITTPARPLLPGVLARLAPWLAGEKLVAEARAVVP